MNNTTEVSVIIVNFNGKKHLEKCLESLMKIEYDKYEVIIVDNNSTDDSIEFVKNNYPSVIIIKLDNNYGFAEPNNIGAKNAKGNFLIFLNNDTVVSPNFVTEMLKPLKKDPQIAICQSLLLKPNSEVDSSGDFLDTLGRAYSSKEKVNEIKKILSASGASMMVRTESFWDLGGFDKNFFASFEDVDIGWRAWIWGYKVVVVPNSIVYHDRGQTTQKYSDIKFHGVKNTFILMLTNFETYNAMSSITKLLFVIFIRKAFGKSLTKNHESSVTIPSLKTIFTGFMWVLKKMNYVLAKPK